MTDHRSTRNYPALAAAGVAIVMPLVGAWYMMTKANARANEVVSSKSGSLPEVQVLTVEPSTVPVVLVARGFLRGFEEVTVHAEVNGRIQERVDKGRRLAPGEVLCRLDDTFYRIAVEQAETNVSVAEASLAEAQAARDNARVENDRVLSLGANAAQIERDRAQTRLSGAEATVRKAEASVLGAGVSLSQAREQLDRCVVRSPIGGRVDQVPVDVGEYAVAGQPLAEIIRLDSMKMEVELTGPEVALLNDKTRAEARVDAVPDHVYTGVIDHVAPKAHPVTRKFRVEIHVDNEDGRLLSGMFGQCRLTCEQREDVIRLPREAVLTRFGADCCYAVEQDGDLSVVRLRQLTTRDIPGQPEALEVIAGLEPGERVVARRARHVVDGAAVRTRSIRGPAPAAVTKP
jgi:membrane fusion protein (multidrug efflux system)